jgi:hypothetical protein
MLWGHRTRAVATSAALLLYHDLCSARSTVQRRLQQGQPPRAQVMLSRWRMPAVTAVTPDLSLASTVNVTPGMSSCFSCSLPLRPPGPAFTISRLRRNTCQLYWWARNFAPTSL